MDKDMKRESRVSRARKFIGGLSLILALSSIGGCSFNNKKDDSQNNNSSYAYEMTNESDNLTEIETPAQVETPDDVKTPEEIDAPENVVPGETQPDNGKEDAIQDNSDKLVGEIPNIGNYSGNSIADALRLAGYPSDYKYRASLATYLGIDNYRGTASQNILMLNMLKEYAKSLEAQIPSNENNNNNNNNNNNDNSNDDNNNNDNNDNDNEEEHEFGKVLTRYEKYDVNSHYEITYQECVDCNYVLELNRELKSHVISNKYTIHEKEDENGYDEVTYGICENCNAVVELSRKYVSKNPVEECDHSKTHTETKYENVTEASHLKVVYEICDDCGNQVGKTETTENHTYGSKKTRHEGETENGYYLVEYEVCTGCEHEHVINRRYVSTIGCEHQYGAVQTRTTYDDEAHKDTVVTYKVCSECGHEEIISTVERTHTHSDSVVSNGDDTHSVIRTYTRSDGSTYSESYDEACTHTKTVITVGESTENGICQKIIYGDCSCGSHKDEEITHHNVNFVDNGTNEIGTCPVCTTTITREHTRYGEFVQTSINPDPNNTSQHIVSGYIECACGHKRDESKTETCVALDKIYTDENGNSYQLCSCGRKMNEKIHTNDDHVFPEGTVYTSDGNGHHTAECSICHKTVRSSCPESAIAGIEECPYCKYKKEQTPVTHEHTWSEFKDIVIDGVTYYGQVCTDADCPGDPNDPNSERYQNMSIKDHEHKYSNPSENTHCCDICKLEEKCTYKILENSISDEQVEWSEELNTLVSYWTYSEKCVCGRVHENLVSYTDPHIAITSSPVTTAAASYNAEEYSETNAEEIVVDEQIEEDVKKLRLTQ